MHLVTRLNVYIALQSVVGAFGLFWWWLFKILVNIPQNTNKVEAYSLSVHSSAFQTKTQLVACYLEQLVPWAGAGNCIRWEPQSPYL